MKINFILSMSFLVIQATSLAREESAGKYLVSNIEPQTTINRPILLRGDFKPNDSSTKDSRGLELVRISKDGDILNITVKYSTNSSSVSLPKGLDASSIVIADDSAYILIRKIFQSGSSPLCVLVIKSENGITTFDYAKTYSKVDGIRVCEVISSSGTRLRSLVSIGVDKYEYVFGDIELNKFPVVKNPSEITEY